MLKELAIALGIPADKAETATEQDLLVAFDACSKKLKADADAEAKKKLDADGNDEEKGKQGKKKFEADIEAKLTEFATKLIQLEADKKGALDLAKKAEVDGLVAEASRDGKVIPLSIEALSKMDTKDIKEMINKLPKSVQLSRKQIVMAKTADGKEITNKRSPEFKAFMATRLEEGALTLGNKILQQATGLNTQN
jgi:citrate lyase gamma subunit